MDLLAFEPLDRGAEVVFLAVLGFFEDVFCLVAGIGFLVTIFL